MSSNFCQIFLHWNVLATLCSMKLGKVIQQLREKQGWGQDELAFRAGTTESNISRIEHDRHEPRAELMGSIAFVFGLKVFELAALAEGVQLAGPTSNYDADEEALLACYRKMYREERALFQALAESLCRVRRIKADSLPPKI